ncbi:hypothetical protein GCM10020255_075880 [Rhodococcus baikonurensis]
MVRIALHPTPGTGSNRAVTGARRSGVVELADVARQWSFAGRRTQPGRYCSIPVVRLSAETAAEIEADNGDQVAVSTESGTVTLPLEITELPPRTVWLPLNSPRSTVYETLCATAGSVVKIAKAGTQ